MPLQTIQHFVSRAKLFGSAPVTPDNPVWQTALAPVRASFAADRAALARRPKGVDLDLADLRTATLLQWFDALEARHIALLRDEATVSALAVLQALDNLTRALPSATHVVLDDSGAWTGDLALPPGSPS